MGFFGSIRSQLGGAARRIVRLLDQPVLDRARLADQEMYRRLFPGDALAQKRFYTISAGGHLGFGGGFSHPFWTNIDVDRPWDPPSAGFDPSRDLAWDPLDLTPVPVGSGTACLVYSRFSLEHITDEAARSLCTEVHRILKPGGLFRVVCPNIDLDHRAYLAGDREYFYWSRNIPSYAEASLEQLYLEHFAGTASTLQSPEVPHKVTDEEFRRLFQTLGFPRALDACTARCSPERQRSNRRNHINWWNPEKLQGFLREAGFSVVEGSAPQQSRSPVMRNPQYFDNLYNEVAFYVEAVKAAE